MADLLRAPAPAALVHRAAQAQSLTDRPLRILMPSYRSNPLTGGQGIYLRHASRALVELGHAVDVISGPPYPELDARVRLIKLPSLDLYARPRDFLGLPHPPLREMRSATDAREYLAHIAGAFGEPRSFGERLARFIAPRKSHYDVVHDNQTLCYGLLKLKALGMPVIGMIHHPITRDRDAALAHAPDWRWRLLIRHWYGFLAMQRRVARALERITVCSHNTKRDVATDFGVESTRMHMVFHGVDTRTFRPRAATPRYPRRLMATASADMPLKGLIYLLRAFAELAARDARVELVIVGKLREGPTARLLAGLGLGERVRFVSDLTDSDLAQLYCEATLVVCPSLYEGFGFPAAEAMACEAPVVATRGGALPEIVGAAGVLVEPADPGALAQAIAQLLDDPARRARLGCEGRAHVVSRFDWSHTAAQYVTLYRQAIADANGRSRASRA